MKILSTDEEIKKIVKECGLNHIAIIMDGNRRWAKMKNLPSALGHKNGVTSLKNVLKKCDDFGVKYLTVYAFSTENWQRAESEVTFLMDLLADTLLTEIEQMHKKNVKVKFIGEIEHLSEKLQNIINESEIMTQNNTGVNLQIAFNYGSRNEITNAVKKIVEQKIPSEKITEELIEKNLYTANVPNPDLLIRTGGEKRISNYLLWQIAYSEIIVLSTFWPDFDTNDLTDCIFEFQKRKRRFGK